jgi:hypothetical protein
MVGMSLFGPSGERGAAVTAGVVELAQQHATLVFTATRAVKAFEHPADVRVTLHLTTVGGKRNLGTGAKQLLDLFNRVKLGLIHVDHYFWVISPTSNSPQIMASGSFLIGQGWGTQCQVLMAKIVRWYPS